MLYALGQTPTGYRSGPNVDWTWLNPGESVRMEHYWKITMDYNYPDQAVYKLGDGYMLQQEQEQMQQGGYGQQQGGYGQQQGGYGQQQGQGQGYMQATFDFPNPEPGQLGFR